MATIIVTTNLDEACNGSLYADGNDGDGLSLREALAHASASDTIEFDASLAGTTLRLIQGQLEINTTLTIDGDVNGDDKADVTISGDADGSGTGNAGDGRVFLIDGGTTHTLQSLTVSEGYAPSADRGGFGGGIYVVVGSTVNLVASTVKDNIATGGGGRDDGTVSVATGFDLLRIDLSVLGPDDLLA